MKTFLVALTLIAEFIVLALLCGPEMFGLVIVAMGASIVLAATNLVATGR